MSIHSSAHHDAAAPDVLPLPWRLGLPALVLTAHAAGGWALLWLNADPTAQPAVATLNVEFVAAVPAEAVPPPPAPPAPVAPPRAVVRPVAATPVVTAPAPVPAEFAAPPVVEPVALAVSAPAVVAEAAPVSPPAPAPVAAPKEIPASAIEYLEPPAPVYPRASRRAREAGLVVVRVFVEIDGVPRLVQLLQSSGFVRLDEAALDSVRQARFKPYRENGRPAAGWARIPIPFELEP